MILLGVKCGTCPFFSSEILESFRICLSFPAFVQKPWHKYDRLDAIKRLKSLCLGLWLKEHLSWQCQHNVNIMSLCSEMRNFNEFQVWSCLRCRVWWRGQFGGKRLKIVSRSLSKTITCPYLRHNADSSRSESSKNQFISRSTMHCVFYCRYIPTVNQCQGIWSALVPSIHSPSQAFACESIEALSRLYKSRILQADLGPQQEMSQGWLAKMTQDEAQKRRAELAEHSKMFSS